MPVSLLLDSLPASLQPVQQQLFADFDQQLAGKSQVYVALSGGMDSVVLTHLLACWRVARTSHASSYPDISAIHVHHGLMAEADHWLAFCEQLAAQLQLGFISERVAVKNHGDGIEQAARQARYKVFEQQCQSGSVLLMGHHADDQLETFLSRASRGSGLGGLSMPAKRPLSVSSTVTIVRPLLSTPRTVLQQWAEHFQLHWVEDPSNTDTGYERNWWRQQCLPAIEQRFPGRKQSLQRTIEHLQQEQQALNLLLEPVLASCVLESRYPLTATTAFSLAAMEQQAPLLHPLLLRHWLQDQCLQLPSDDWLQQLLMQARSADDRQMQMTIGPWQLRRFQQTLYLCKAVDVPQAAREFELVAGQVLGDIPWAGGTVGLPDLPPGRYSISCQPLAGLSNKASLKPVGRPSKTLKHVWQEAQIPAWLRPCWPLLLRWDESEHPQDCWLLCGVLGVMLDGALLDGDLLVNPLLNDDQLYGRGLNLELALGNYRRA